MSRLDLLVIVGGRVFPANRTHLAAHSDYFKDVLGHMGEEDRHLVLPTMIPAEHFSLLLSSMQSSAGLAPSISQDNVYQLLLYAQLLQMPAAVAHCKAFLASTVQGPSVHGSSSFDTPPPTVLRPIPSKLFPGLPVTPQHHHQQQQIWRPYWSQFFQHCGKDDVAINQQQHWAPNLFPLVPVRRPPVVVLCRNSPSLPLTPHQTSRDDQTAAAAIDSKQRLDVKLEPREEEENEKETTEDAGQHIHLDIAACDGPVQFHRIPNTNMSTAVNNRENNMEDDCDDSNTSSSSSEVFQCIFCNHVFKSHYCYQKHKKRHLNPFASAAADAHEVVALDSEKRTLMLRDINVQFFPCKVCGAKFPSYYFVHKHKKMWHSELSGEEEEAGCSSPDLQNASSSSFHPQPSSKKIEGLGREKKEETEEEAELKGVKS